MKLDPNIYDKLVRYCNYQERCEAEVKSKLRTLHVYDVDIYIDELIDDDYLNEGRFADSYAVGKFRLKYWGKQKIKAHLGQKRISSAAITHALDQIDMDDYESRAVELIERKWEDVKGKDAYEKKGKVYRYMQQKGYESSLISSLISIFQKVTQS